MKEGKDAFKFLSWTTDWKEASLIKLRNQKRGIFTDENTPLTRSDKIQKPIGLLLPKRTVKNKQTQFLQLDKMNNQH